MLDLVPAGVTLLALGFYFYTIIQVGRARSKYSVQPPAMTGPPEFERTIRVQMNTLEWMVLFLPAFWLFCAYVDQAIGGALGVIWVLGRVMYAQGYIADPAKRGMGFLVQFVAWVLLFLGTLGGVVWKWAGWAPLLTQPLL